MKISMPVDYGRSFQDAAQHVVDMEKAGLDMVWIAEAYGFDAVSMMGYLAAKTERITIGSGILPIYTRTPTLLAQTAAGLDALSGGRFELGLGASGPQVIEGFHGVPYLRPLAYTREVIEICRTVWKREEKLTHAGDIFQLPLPAERGTGLGKPLKIINHPVRSDIPIHIASLGPKNVELTAELADGWLPLFYLPERANDVWGDALARGEAKRSSDRGPLEINAGSLMAIGEEAASMREFARPMAALYIGGMGAKGKNFYNTLMQRYGYEKEAEIIQDLYLDGKKDEAAAVIPDEFLEKTTLCGPEGFVKERVEAFKEAGVTNLMVTPVGEPTEIIEKVRAWID